MEDIVVYSTQRSLESTEPRKVTSTVSVVYYVIRPEESTQVRCYMLRRYS